MTGHCSTAAETFYANKLSFKICIFDQFQLPQADNLAGVFSQNFNQESGGSICTRIPREYDTQLHFYEML